MNNLKIIVDQAKFIELEKCLCGQELGNDKVKATTHVQGKEYVIHSAMGDGTGVGWKCFWGHEVKYLTLYKGNLKPLFHTEHHIQIDLGKRSRSYTGQKARFGKRLLVLTGEKVEFVCHGGSTQATLF